MTEFPGPFPCLYRREPEGEAGFLNPTQSLAGQTSPALSSASTPVASKALLYLMCRYIHFYIHTCKDILSTITCHLLIHSISIYIKWSLHKISLHVFSGCKNTKLILSQSKESCARMTWCAHLTCFVFKQKQNKGKKNKQNNYVEMYTSLEDSLMEEHGF